MSNTFAEANAIAPRARSRRTNGKRYITPVDGRLAPARRLRDIRHSLIARIGGEPTAHQIMMIESASSVQVQLELMRVKQAKGEVVDSVILIKLANALRRHLRDLALSEADVPQSVRHGCASPRSSPSRSLISSPTICARRTVSHSYQALQKPCASTSLVKRIRTTLRTATKTFARAIPIGRAISSPAKHKALLQMVPFI